MRRFRLLFPVAFLAMTMLMNGCSSTNISKLEGQWQLFWINDLGDGVVNSTNPQCNDNIYIWNFEGGEITIVMYIPPTPANPNPQSQVAGRAQYKTSAEFLDAVVEISGFEQSISNSCVIPMISNGKWTIDKIDNEVMRLGTSDQEGSGGSYVIREFTRVE